MNEYEHLIDKLEKAIKGEHHYPLDAYRFVMDALHATVSKLDKHRHITGKELLQGIRDFALEQFGPLTRSVLSHWGVRKTQDFGQIVFDLVDAGVLRKQPEDSLEDFENIYDFKEAFDQKFFFPDEPAHES